MSRNMNLTAAYLRSLKPGPKLMWFNDFGRGAVTGLRFGVTIRGAKSWSLRYTRSGQRKSIALGAWPAVSLSKARDLARAVQLRVAQGEDPAEEKRRGRREATVSELAERVYREHYVAKRKPRTAKSARTLIDLHIRPSLGRGKITELTTSDISAWHAKIGIKHPGAANRALATLSCMCTCALRWNLLTHNPRPVPNHKLAKNRSPWACGARAAIDSKSRRTRCSDDGHNSSELLAHVSPPASTSSELGFVHER